MDRKVCCMHFVSPHCIQKNRCSIKSVASVRSANMKHHFREGAEGGACVRKECLCKWPVSKHNHPQSPLHKIRSAVRGTEQHCMTRWHVVFQSSEIFGQKNNVGHPEFLVKARNIQYHVHSLYVVQCKFTSVPPAHSSAPGYPLCPCVSSP